MSPRPTVALLLAACCLLAGCTAVGTAPAEPSSGTTPPVDRDAEAGRTTDTADTLDPGAAGGDAGARPANASSPDPETAPPRESPWSDGTVAVAVVVPSDADGRYAEAARSAAAFWSANDRRYLGYEVDLRVTAVVHAGRADAVAWSGLPDVVVRVVDSVGPCGASNPVGCAPVVRRGPVDRPVTVRVRAGLDRDSTERVVRHELGHVLGLTHSDAPTSVMGPSMTVRTVPKPNATDRAFPWADRTLDVYVDVAAADDPAAARRSVDRALGYLVDAPGLPAVEFRRVGSAADADVTIRVERTPAPDDRCACYRLSGPDPDGDGALEEYRGLTLTLRDLPPETLAWHVGDRLSYALGAEARADRPTPFRRADPAARRATDWGR